MIHELVVQLEQGLVLQKKISCLGHTLKQVGPFTYTARALGFALLQAGFAYYHLKFKQKTDVLQCIVSTCTQKVNALSDIALDIATFL